MTKVTLTQAATFTHINGFVQIKEKNKKPTHTRKGKTQQCPLLLTPTEQGSFICWDIPSRIEAPSKTFSTPHLASALAAIEDNAD